MRRLVPLLIPPQLAAVAALLAVLGTPALAQAPDLQAVAHNLVNAGMIKAGDKVLITGSVRDVSLLEHLAIETMKVGGQPLLSIWSEQLTRRSYDEVPATYDSQSPTFGLALVDALDAQIAVDVGETENLLAGVPTERLAARSKAGQPVGAAFLRRSVRLVSLGNGLYPTPPLARRLGIPLDQLASTFWRAAGVPAQTLRAKSEVLGARLANAKQVSVTHPNGTNLTFGVTAGRSFISSEGALTADKVRQGGAAVSTWLPAGEFIIPAATGTAEGKVVIDKVLWDGEEVRGLTLTYSKGRLTSMTAASGLQRLQARYDAAAGAKDLFAYIDIGLNPEAGLPLGTGWIVWMAPGAVTFGLGDNQGFGGTNVSDFGLPTQLGGATVKVDGVVLVENGTLK